MPRGEKALKVGDVPRERWEEIHRKRALLPIGERGPYLVAVAAELSVSAETVKYWLRRFFPNPYRKRSSRVLGPDQITKLDRVMRKSHGTATARYLWQTVLNGPKSPSERNVRRWASEWRAQQFARFVRAQQLALPLERATPAGPVVHQEELPLGRPMPTSFARAGDER